MVTHSKIYIGPAMSSIDLTKKLDPQMRTVLELQAKSPAYTGSVRGLSPEEARRHYREERAAWNSDAPELPRVDNISIPGTNRDIPLRLYYPLEGEALPTLVFLHGGGWILGDLDTHDKIMRLLAREGGFLVAGVDYGLAPEHKFPSQIEECVAAVTWLASHASRLAIDPECIAIGGDSAGANLSLATALGLRDQGQDLIKAMLLYYGAFGLKDSVSQRLYGGDEDGLSKEEMDYYRTSLVRDPKDLDDPRLNSLRADLANLPPAFVAAAELDPLLDDSKALVELMAAQGGYSELKIYPGVLHGFLHYSRILKKARVAIRDGADFLREIIAR